MRARASETVPATARSAIADSLRPFCFGCAGAESGTRQTYDFLPCFSVVIVREHVERFELLRPLRAHAGGRDAMCTGVHGSAAIARGYGQDTRQYRLGTRAQHTSWALQCMHPCHSADGHATRTRTASKSSFVELTAVLSLSIESALHIETARPTRALPGERAPGPSSARASRLHLYSTLVLGRCGKASYSSRAIPSRNCCLLNTHSRDCGGSACNQYEQ